MDKTTSNSRLSRALLGAGIGALLMSVVGPRRGRRGASAKKPNKPQHTHRGGRDHASERPRLPALAGGAALALYGLRHHGLPATLVKATGLWFTLRAFSRKGPRQHLFG